MMSSCPKNSPQGTGLVSFLRCLNCISCRRPHNGWRHWRSPLLELHVQLGQRFLHGGFVNIFREDISWFSVPNIFTSSMLPLRIFSWIQRSAVERCRIFPSPRLLAIPIAAVASLCSRIWRSIPISRHTDCKPIAWAAPYAIPPNSASPLESAMVDCVLDQCLTQHEPMTEQPPEVDRLVMAQPAKSVSTYVSMAVGGFSWNG